MYVRHDGAMVALSTSDKNRSQETVLLNTYTMVSRQLYCLSVLPDLSLNNSFLFGEDIPDDFNWDTDEIYFEEEYIVIEDEFTFDDSF